ncbi:aegerolysin family protein [Vibrio metschnikovii]|uniref:aegerolysin family protein n=1 Tax=Vibrio TaxID=662 RepID=UPI000D7324AA|nr:MULTISPECIES: aegerolysin family protein [Vibrio]EKO3566976.1 aegerolysin family protein [Vibrio metschnikovii]EKO3580699.1 aegerolysin family protein [Vibrio metschnikovii]EKO3629391.1 aegerolysin family protein [Vibrio metschnikovii]EKO3660621.1 aegerolysin family protein [Vibrio metschnikovii]EKO3667742.1 aegerolysin family protein [Vibrio metschnikovii]
MAYAQWISITIEPKNYDVTIKNIHSDWGKFYQGSKDNEISPEDIDGRVVKAGEKFTISSCGRSDASSGTEGSFDIYRDDTHVGNYYWDCPWGSKTNTSTWTNDNSNFITQVTGGNLDSGAIGNVSIVSVYIG